MRNKLPELLSKLIMQKRLLAQKGIIQSTQQFPVISLKLIFETTLYSITLAGCAGGMTGGWTGAGFITASVVGGGCPSITGGADAGCAW